MPFRLQLTFQSQQQQQEDLKSSEQERDEAELNRCYILYHEGLGKQLKEILKVTHTFISQSQHCFLAFNDMCQSIKELQESLSGDSFIQESHFPSDDSLDNMNDFWTESDAQLLHDEIIQPCQRLLGCMKLLDAKMAKRNRKLLDWKIYQFKLKKRSKKFGGDQLSTVSTESICDTSSQSFSWGPQTPNRVDQTQLDYFNIHTALLKELPIFIDICEKFIAHCHHVLTASDMRFKNTVTLLFAKRIEAEQPKSEDPKSCQMMSEWNPRSQSLR